MNKIYKVVWSKVKNCYVVVSEIAKNVITGAVKSAKVGSSVASGLAMGALMAFVITGNAMAADMTINADNKIGLTDAQVDWAVIGQSDFAVDGKLTINSNANSISAFGHTDNSEAKMTVTANGLEATTVNGTAVFVAGDHKNANLTINAGEGDVKITGTGEAHGIAVKSQGGSATINAADIKVTATENGVYAREDGAAITLNGANVTVESTGMQTDAGKGHAVYVDQNAQVTIDATGDVTLKAADGKYAIGINGGEDLVKDAVVTVKAGNNVDIDGQVFARQEATVNIEGTNVTVDTDSKDAISVSGGTVNVTATDDIKLTSKQNDGVQVVEGTVKLQANDVAIDASNWGVKATLDKGGNIVVTADTINVTGKNGGGIYNEGKNGVALNADNGVEVNGKVYVNYGGSVNVVAGAGDVTINGDVDAAHGTSVNVSGQNVTLAATGADAIQGVATTVNITASDKITITSDKKDGIESCASTVSLKANNVEITSGAWGVVGTGDAGTDIDINANTIKIDGAKGGIRNLAASDVTVTATDKVEVFGDVYATGDGAIITVDGGKETYIKGDVYADSYEYKNGNHDGVNTAETVKINLKGETITVDATDNNGIFARSHYNTSEDSVVINVGTDATKEINVKNAYIGLWADYNGSQVNVNGAEGAVLNITDAEYAGICAMNGTTGPDGDWNSDSDASDNAIVNIGKNIKTVITGTDTGIMALSEGKVNIAGDLKVDASDNALYVRGFSDVKINEANDDAVKVQLDGDVNFGYQKKTSDTPVDADITINLANKDSYLNGNIIITAADGDVIPEGYDNVTGMKLGLSNGATWTTDGAVANYDANGNLTSKGSFVNELDVHDANIVIKNAQAESISVGTLTGTSMYVDIASVKGQQMRASAGNNDLSGVITVDEIGDSDNDGEKDNVRVSVTTSGVNMNAANAKDYKDIVRVGNDEDGYKGIVNEIDAKNTYISGDVKFKDDGNGGFKVVDTTLNGDVNVTGKFTAGEIIAENVYTKDEVDKQVADKFAEVEADYKAADAELQANIDKEAQIRGEADNKLQANIDAEAQARQEADNKLQANIDAEAQARQEADNRLQANIDANAANIANNASNIEANKQAIDAEKAAREEADAALSDAIDNVAGDIAETKAQVEDNKAAIEQNAQDIANETADRVAADNKLQQKLDKESVDRQIADAQERAERAQADQELQNAIDAEEQARKDADAAEAKVRSEEDQRIENKFDGEVNRLDNRIDKVDAKIDKVGAMAAAMASLKTMGYDPEAPTEIAVGIGQYRNETGIAIGAFHYPNKNFMLNFSLSTAGDEVMGGIGATWKIGRKR